MEAVREFIKREAIKHGLVLHEEKIGKLGFGFEFRHAPGLSEDVEGHLKIIAQKLNEAFPSHATKIEQQKPPTNSWTKKGSTRRTSMIWSRIWVRLGQLD